MAQGKRKHHITGCMACVYLVCLVACLLALDRIPTTRILSMHLSIQPVALCTCIHRLYIHTVWPEVAPAPGP